MSDHPPARDALEQLSELNYMFLAHLQRRARSGQDGFGLSSESLAVVESAADSRLEAAADFPQALFRIRFDDEAVLERRASSADAAELDALRSLQHMVLLCARTLCRSSEYGARLYLGLSRPQVRRMRTMSLAELAARARSRGVLKCNFSKSRWFWRELIGSDGANRRHLVLIGLQPRISCETGIQRSMSISV